MKMQGITEIGGDGPEVDMRGRYKQLSSEQMRKVLEAAADLRRMPPRQVLQALGLNPSGPDVDQDTEHLPAPYGAGDFGPISSNVHLSVALLRKNGDGDMTPLFDSCDETKCWQKIDVDRVNGKMQIIGMCYSSDDAKNETYVDLNHECDISKAAPNVMVTNLKRADWYDVMTISALPFWHDACNKAFVSQHMLKIREAIGKEHDAYSLASGMDCHSSFTEWAKITIGLKPIPDTPWASGFMWATLKTTHKGFR